MNTLIVIGIVGGGALIMAAIAFFSQRKTGVTYDTL
jgi:hypothetical protein